MTQALTPTSFEEAAEGLREAAAAGRSVRIVGGGTKQHWGSPTPEPAVAIRSTELDRIVEHNEGDLTAVLEAGCPLDRAQRQFASCDQMLAFDPFLGQRDEATVGGIVATGDAGPLRHRYGAPRDLVLGITVALSDGTVAHSGGKVIKNVAGYDLGKLFCGSFGTLGMILSVSVRLHPLPAATVTTLGTSRDPRALAAAGRTLAAAPLELEALDVAWRGGRGGILARSGGVQAGTRAQRVAALMREAGLDQIENSDADAELWRRQRAGQRSANRVMIRVAARPSALAEVLRATEEAGGTLVGRVALGHSFVEVEPEAMGGLARRLPAGAVATVLDAPEAVRRSVDPWGPPASEAALELMRRVKMRFDPAQVCNPGVFVAGI